MAQVGSRFSQATSNQKQHRRAAALTSTTQISKGRTRQEFSPQAEAQNATDIEIGKEGERRQGGRKEEMAPLCGPSYGKH